MINNNEEMGVRASYMENTNQFVLTAKETGSGRKIVLGGGAETIFGCKAHSDGYSRDGQDAKVLVSYRDGIEREITSSSNSFDLEGLTVTVSNTFGITEKKVNDQTIVEYSKDKSQKVTFSASADAEGVTERVKSFIEAYNELIKEVNGQVTTKPNGNYKPLTDEQKKEMDKESIENWEKKAKEGILFNNPIIRDLGNGLQGVLSGLMGNGVDAAELEKIGITMSKLSLIHIFLIFFYVTGRESKGDRFIKALVLWVIGTKSKLHSLQIGTQNICRAVLKFIFCYICCYRTGFTLGI